MRLTIHDLDQNGTGVGRDEEGRVVFCEGVLPGENLTATPIPDTRPQRAVLEHILETSPDRQTPPCPFFGRCGGCDIQHLDYEASLQWKYKRAFDLLQRIGGFSPEHLRATAVADRAVASPKRFGYRNHVRYSIEEAERPGLAPKVGFLARQSHDVVDQEAIGCLIAAGIADKIRMLFIEAVTEHRMILKPFPHSLQVRQGEATGEVLVIFHVGKSELSEDWKRLTRFIRQEVGIESAYEAVGVLVRHEERKGRRLQAELQVLHGRPYYYEELGGYRCPVHAEGFFQVNTPQASNIACTLGEWAEGTPRRVWDIYGGTGTLGMPFAAQGAQVTVVERTAGSEDYGRMQAEENGLDRQYRFLEGDAAKLVPQLAQREGRPDLVITDPPRQGLAQAVVDAVLSAEVPQWLYVSCDPATLARDLKIICEGGYEVRKWQVFDMCPWTGHIESIILMTYCGLEGK